MKTLYTDKNGEISENVPTFIWRNVRTERLRVQTYIDDPSMTDQSYANECDVNWLVAQFDRSGTLPPATREPVYADVTGLQGDPTELMETAKETIDIAEKFRKSYKPKQEKVDGNTIDNDTATTNTVSDS